jgi:hypothetical protein
MMNFNLIIWIKKRIRIRNLIKKKKESKINNKNPENSKTSDGKEAWKDGR